MVLFAKDIVEPKFLVLPADTNALDAAKRMKAERQGYVIILRDGKPQGIVTEWDYISKVVAEGKNPSYVTLREIMSEGLITVDSKEGLEEVAKAMAAKGVRRVLVLQDGAVIGVITSRTMMARLEEYVNSVSTTIARLQAPPS